MKFTGRSCEGGSTTDETITTGRASFFRICSKIIQRTKNTKNLPGNVVEKIGSEKNPVGWLWWNGWLAGDFEREREIWMKSGEEVSFWYLVNFKLMGRVSMEQIKKSGPGHFMTSAFGGNGRRG